MTEKETLEYLLASIKYKMQVLEAIEKRLIEMLDYAQAAVDLAVLDSERSQMQLKLDKLHEEIKLLEREPTLPS